MQARLQNLSAGLRPESASPSKLGVARRSSIAWLNVFFICAIVLFLLFNKMPSLT